MNKKLEAVIKVVKNRVSFLKNLAKKARTRPQNTPESPVMATPPTPSIEPGSSPVVSPLGSVATSGSSFSQGSIEGSTEESAIVLSSEIVTPRAEPPVANSSTIPTASLHHYHSTALAISKNLDVEHGWHTDRSHNPKDVNSKKLEEQLPDTGYDASYTPNIAEQLKIDAANYQIQEKEILLNAPPTKLVYRKADKELAALQELANLSEPLLALQGSLQPREVTSTANTSIRSSIQP